MFIYMKLNCFGREGIFQQQVFETFMPPFCWKSDNQLINQ